MIPRAPAPAASPATCPASSTASSTSTAATASTSPTPKIPAPTPAPLPPLFFAVPVPVRPSLVPDRRHLLGRPRHPRGRRRRLRPRAAARPLPTGRPASAPSSTSWPRTATRPSATSPGAACAAWPPGRSAADYDPSAEPEAAQVASRLGCKPSWVPSRAPTGSHARSAPEPVDHDLEIGE